MVDGRSQDEEEEEEEPGPKEDPVVVYEGELGVATAETGIEEGWRGLDLGEATIAAFRGACARAQTVVWTGVMGHVECDTFQAGTREVLDAVVAATSAGRAKSIVIGESSVESMEEFGIAEKDVSYVSKGEACSRSILAGMQVPGVSQLAEK